MSLRVVDSVQLDGAPTAPTPVAGTNNTQIATTAYVRGEVSAVVSSAPSTLDTLQKLAAAIGNDASYSTTVSSALATKAPLSSPTFTGIVALTASSSSYASLRMPHGVAPSSPSNGDMWTTTDGFYVRVNGSTIGPLGAPPALSWGSITGSLDSQTDLKSVLDAKAPLASPTFTGTPAAPTATADTATTQVATTEFVVNQGYLKVAQSGDRTYVQANQPTASGRYLWIQTGLGTDGTDMTLWIEDGT